MSNMQPLTEHTQVMLEKGLQLKFKEDMPTYEVTEITPDHVTFKCMEKLTSAQKTEGLPETFTATKLFTIGRYPDSSLQLAPGTISRRHQTIGPNPNNGQWYLTHYSRNRAEVRHPDHDVTIRNITETHKDAAEITFISETVSNINPSEPLPPFPIINGMEFHFHPALPAYKARISKEDGSLTLERSNKEDLGYPRMIKVGVGESITLGRKSGEHCVVLPHPDISGEHAHITWDAKTQAFIYEHTGRRSPVVRLPQLMEELQQAYAKLSLSPEQAEQQSAAIDTLVTQLKTHTQQVQDVQRLEVDTVLTPWYQRDVGARTEDSQKGYEMWLRAYELLFRERLTEDTSKGLLHMAEVVKQLGDDRANLRDVENYSLPDKASERDTELNKYIAEKIHALEATGEVYLVAGNKGHHAITRIRKDGAGGYLVTNYNAGADAEGGLISGQVLGTCERRLKPEQNVGRVIRLVTESKLSRLLEAYTLGREIEAMLEPQILRSRETSAQGKGNCTTRSTREMLKDTLEPTAFSHMHGYVSDPNMATAEDLISALQLKLQALKPAPIKEVTGPVPPIVRPDDGSHSYRGHSPTIITR